MKARAALAALTLFFGLWGIRWCLPSKERAALILPPGLDTPAFHHELQESWTRMHAALGENLMTASQELTNFQGLQTTRAGWAYPPDLLQNPVRSFYLRTGHDDEQTFLLLFGKMRPKSLDFRPRMYLYGGGYLYPLGAWIGAWTLAGAGHLSHSLEEYLARPEGLAGLYLSGRLFSLAALILGVLLTYRIGLELLPGAGAFIAASVYALSPAAQTQAHFMKQHTLWPLWTMLAFFLCLRILRVGKTISYAAAGAAAGGAVGTFSLSVFTCLFIPAAAWIRLRRKEGDLKEESRGMVFAALAAAAVFFLVNPYWLSDWKDVWAELSVQKSYSEFHPLALFRFAAIPLRLALTWPVELAAFLGLGLILKERRDDKLMLLASCFVLALLPVYYSAAAYQERGMRYCMALIPLGGLLAASLLTRLREPLGKRAWAALAAAMGLHLTLSAATASNNFSAAAGEASTYRQAGRWLEENVPEGASIGLWGFPARQRALFPLDRTASPCSTIATRDPAQEKLPTSSSFFSRTLSQAPGPGRPSSYEKVETFEAFPRPGSASTGPRPGQPRFRDLSKNPGSHLRP